MGTRYRRPSKKIALMKRDGFRQRGALGHLSFWGPAQVWPIRPFVWKARKRAPPMCSAPSKIYLFCADFGSTIRSGISKLRTASQIRPATPFHPAREEICQ